MFDLTGHALITLTAVDELLNEDELVTSILGKVRADPVDLAKGAVLRDLRDLKSGNHHQAHAQKYHFMRHGKQTPLEAYQEAMWFIQDQMLRSAKALLWLMRNSGGSGFVGPRDREGAMGRNELLALAQAGDDVAEIYHTATRAMNRASEAVGVGLRHFVITGSWPESVGVARSELMRSPLQNLREFLDVYEVFTRNVTDSFAPVRAVIAFKGGVKAIPQMGEVDPPVSAEPPNGGSVIPNVVRRLATLQPTGMLRQGESLPDMVLPVPPLIPMKLARGRSEETDFLEGFSNAAHAAQDSFSPAHVTRGGSIPAAQPPPGGRRTPMSEFLVKRRIRSAPAGPIEDIHDYNCQDSTEHAEEDKAWGRPGDFTQIGRWAIEVTKEILLMIFASAESAYHGNQWFPCFEDFESVAWRYLNGKPLMTYLNGEPLVTRSNIPERARRPFVPQLPPRTCPNCKRPEAGIRQIPNYVTVLLRSRNTPARNMMNDMALMAKAKLEGRDEPPPEVRTDQCYRCKYCGCVWDAPGARVLL